MIQQGSLPRKSEVTDERHLKIIREGTVAGLEPVRLYLNYDDSCNLSCPSCRANAMFVGSGPEFDRRKQIHEKVVAFAFGEPHTRELVVTITGAGDPFGSKLFREFLFGLDGSGYPNVKIWLHTNGVAFTPAAWDRLSRIHQNLGRVIVSVDAGNEPDYQITRRGGHWPTLLENLEFLGRRRVEKAIDSLILNLIVQRDNFRGIPDFVRIGKNVGADCCYFSLMTDWGTWTREEFVARSIWSREHPQFDEFLAVMADPILGDGIVDLGNAAEYRKTALALQESRVTAARATPS